MFMTGPLKAFLNGADSYYVDQRFMSRMQMIPTIDEAHAISSNSRGCLIIHDDVIVLIELKMARSSNSCVDIWTYDTQQGALVHEYTAFSRRFAGSAIGQEENDVFNLAEGYIGLASDTGAVVLDEFLRLCLDASSRGEPKAFEKDHSTIHYVVKRDESNNRGWFIQPRKTNEDPNGVTYQNFFREVKELSALNCS